MTWKKFIGILYLLAFIFSSIATVLTVTAMGRYPGLILEAYPSTNQIFATYGLFVGVIIIISETAVFIFGSLLVFGFLFLIAEKYLKKNHVVCNLTVALIFSLFEVEGLTLFVIHLLDMYHDLHLLPILFHLQSALSAPNPPFTPELLDSVYYVLFLSFLILSLSIRITKQPRIHRHRSRV